MTTVLDPPALDLLHRAVTGFGDLVAGLRDPDWAAATPCAGWTVRDLVNHVTAEDLWAAQLLAGRTIAEVGDRFEGDQLGTAAQARWQDAAAAALTAAVAPGAMDDLVHLSFGDVPGSEYARQLVADHLVHRWDLAVAVGADPRLPAADVEACLAWFGPNEDAYRAAGLIGPRQPSAPDADPTTRLLAAFGRTS